jgi:hypothetical protein
MILNLVMGQWRKLAKGEFAFIAADSGLDSSAIAIITDRLTGLVLEAFIIKVLAAAAAGAGRVVRSLGLEPAY